MRDKERGVVWEETIILLPHKVLGRVRSVCITVVIVARMGGVASIRLDVGTRCAKQSRTADIVDSNVGVYRPSHRIRAIIVTVPSSHC